VPQTSFAIIAIGNMLQKDDGMGIFAAKYLEENYSFNPSIDIIQGGVEGVNLLNTFMEYDEILFFDCVDTSDESGTIYLIPTTELKTSGMVQNSAHEMGLLECLGMLELMGEAVPLASLLGIVPGEIKTEIGLSSKLYDAFDVYIRTAIKYISASGVQILPKKEMLSVGEIIQSFR
jgi:hydrogenase maturation protease